MPKRLHLSKRERRRILGDWAFLTPQLVLYLGLAIVPFIVALPVLFTDTQSFTDTHAEFVGLSNFGKIFTDDSIRRSFWPAVGRTATFLVLNYVMVFAFGLTLALLMYEVGLRGWAFTVIYLPMMVSGLALGYIAVMLFSRSTGSLNLLLMELGLMDGPIDIKTSRNITLLMPILVGWKYAGFNMAIFLSGLMAIPRETIEAAIIDGASYRQRLFHVYFPQMVPSFVIATILCMFGSVRIFGELVALGALYGNREAEFISIVIFKYAFGGNRLAPAMAISIQIGIPLLVAAAVLQRLQKRWAYH